MRLKAVMLVFLATAGALVAPAHAQENPHRLIPIKPDESVLRVTHPSMTAEPSRSWKRDAEMFRAVEEYSMFVGSGRFAVIVYAVAAPGVRAGKGEQAKEYGELLRGFLFDKNLPIEWRETGEGESPIARNVPYQLFSVAGNQFGCASFVRNYQPGPRGIDATKRLAGIYCQADGANLPHQAIKDFIAAISIRG